MESSQGSVHWLNILLRCSWLVVAAKEGAARKAPLRKSISAPACTGFKLTSYNKKISRFHEFDV